MVRNAGTRSLTVSARGARGAFALVAALFVGAFALTGCGDEPTSGVEDVGSDPELVTSPSVVPNGAAVDTGAAADPAAAGQSKSIPAQENVNTFDGSQQEDPEPAPWHEGYHSNDG